MTVPSLIANSGKRDNLAQEGGTPMAPHPNSSRERLKGPWRMLGWGALAGVWLLPLVAMQVSAEMNWDETDFIVFGAMLLGVGGLFELAVRGSRSLAFRLGAGVALLAGFGLVWINLAVGIIGSEDNPANLLFFAILALGLMGGALARFKASEMARILVAMAVTQGLVGVAALLLRWGAEAPSFPQAIIVLTGFFAGLWLAAAWLFRRAARGRGEAASAA
jgi:hypothetical protein